MATKTKKDEPKQKRRNIMMSDPLWDYAEKYASREETSVSAVLRKGLLTLAAIEKKRNASAGR